MEAYDSSSDVFTYDMMHSDWWDRGWYGSHDGEVESRERLWASRWHQLFGSDGRSTLTWRGRFDNVPSLAVVYNFYSSGEEVFARHSAATRTPGPLNYTLNQLGNAMKGEYSWALQEKLKGTVITGGIMGSIYGGWGVNPREWATRERSGRPHRRRSGPGQWGRYQTDMPSSSLVENPFFRPYRQGILFSGPADVRDNLYGSSGGSFVNSLYGTTGISNRDRLLSEMIPAESLGVGGNAVEALSLISPESNFNMHTQGKNGGYWAVDRSDSRWRHSDIREVGYPYTKKVFDRLVNLGGLKNDN